MKTQTLQYFVHEDPAALRLELAGDLNYELAHQLEQDWRTAPSAIGARPLIVDLSFVTDADETGRALLERWNATGAKLITKSKLSADLAKSIANAPLPTPAPACEALSPKLSWVFLLAAILFPLQSRAASLKTETVAAWDTYVQSVRSDLQNRTRPGGRFLWVAEDNERLAKVHSGEIVVAPASGSMPRRVPGGLIHHWVGSAFFPNAGLNDVLDVTQNYDRFQEFYRPSVIASRTLARSDSGDTFSMQLMNKVFFLKTALDADYHATNVRLNDRRFYSVSQTTRVQEIEDYGQPGERRIPEGEGGGFVWKLFSIVRLEQSDGGVYVEMEVVALSREIPSAVRLVVDPIVRRVSRNSLLTSIKQTQDAVNCNLSASTKRLDGALAFTSTR
jgi:hypothetical protein